MNTQGVGGGGGGEKKRNRETNNKRIEKEGRGGQK